MRDCITQKILAAKAGISQSYLCEILNGKKTPSTKVAERLESATGEHRLRWLYPHRFDRNGNEFPEPAPCTPE
jgi:transcriptional regulator with XRE-family HTH domain